MESEDEYDTAVVDLKELLSDRKLFWLLPFASPESYLPSKTEPCGLSTGSLSLGFLIGSVHGELYKEAGD